MKKINKNKKIYLGLGIGMILGWFESYAIFTQIGVNGLISLVIFGVAVLVLCIIHVYGKDESRTVLKDKGAKTITGEKQVWKE